MELSTLAVVFLAVNRAASTVTTLCGQYDTVASTDDRYTFNTDVWGGYTQGVQCIYFDPDLENEDNSTWLTSTWTWAQNELEVHSYAHVALTSSLLPLSLSTLGALVVNASYTLAPGNIAASASDIQGIADLNTRCDVVLDTFLDTNAEFSTDATKGSIEVMIWLAAYGGIVPTGNQTSHSVSLDGYVFSLFNGTGPTDQTVYSWWPSSNISTFNQDVSPIFEYMLDKDLLGSSLYLGLVAFGTETEHTDNDQNVTWASQIRLDVSEKQNNVSPSSMSTSSMPHSLNMPSSTSALASISEIESASKSQLASTAFSASLSATAMVVVSSSTPTSSANAMQTSQLSSPSTSTASPSAAVQHDSSAAPPMEGNVLPYYAVAIGVFIWSQCS